MEQFIGTKIVQAEPAHRFWMPDGEKVIVPYSEDRPQKVADAVACDNGYKVVYQPDGYESWSPADVFEAAYRRTDGLNFGLAIEAAKVGERIARRGWNGKGQYVELGTCFQYTSHSGDVPKSTCVQHTDIGSAALVFVGTRGRQVGWLASQADMLADDWYIVE